MADLQEIVDDLEAEIRRPISVEDRRWRLLAHSVQPDEADAVRRSSILTRETSPDVVAWLDGLGLQRARDLVDVPRNDELGMIRRGCLPIRHGDVLLGFLWVIVGDRPLTASEKGEPGARGEEVADNLWRRHRDADDRERRTRDQLAALLHGQESGLAAILRWPQTGVYAIAVSDAIPNACALRRADYVASDDALLVRDPRQLATALAEAGATGGVIAPFARLADAPEALRQAKVAALCAARRSGPGRRLRPARQLGADRRPVGRRRTARTARADRRADRSTVEPRS